jgi:hypothetical protein
MRNLRLIRSPEHSNPGPRPATRPLAITPLDPDVRALLEHARIIAPVPQGVRARVLARARAVIAAAAREARAAPTAPARRRSRTIC